MKTPCAFRACTQPNHSDSNWNNYFIFYSSRLLYMLLLNSNAFPWYLPGSLNRHKEECASKLHWVKCYFGTSLKDIVEKFCPFIQAADHELDETLRVKFPRAVYISLSTMMIPELINTPYIKITKMFLLLHLNLYRNMERIKMEFSDRIREGRQLDFMLNT